MKSLQMIDFNIFAEIILNMVKKCFFCGSSNVIHNGLRGHIQRYKCKDCGRRFDGGRQWGERACIAWRLEVVDDIILPEKTAFHAENAEIVQVERDSAALRGA